MYLTLSQIRQYLQGKGESDQGLADLTTRKVSPKHTRMLNLSRDWLRSYLPHCLQKIDRVSFGLLNAMDLKRAYEIDPLMPKVCF